MIHKEDLPEGAWGYPKVQGFCPACGCRALFLASGGYVTCANIPCPNPTQVTDLLNGPFPARLMSPDPKENR